MEYNLLLPFIMREIGATVNETPKIHCTDPTKKNHCITFFYSELKIPLYTNATFYFFHTRRPTADELKSYEKIFIAPDRQHWNPYFISYELNEISMLNYEGEITQETFQEHYLVDHKMDDVNIESITATTYDQHIDNITDNDYFAHVYNIPNNPDSEFTSALNQRSAIFKMMGSIGSVIKKNHPVNVFLIQ